MTAIVDRNTVADGGHEEIATADYDLASMQSQPGLTDIQTGDVVDQVRCEDQHSEDFQNGQGDLLSNHVVVTANDDPASMQSQQSLVNNHSDCLADEDIFQPCVAFGWILLSNQVELMANVFKFL